MIDNIYYYTGFIFWLLFAVVFVAGIILLLWRYLSISFVLWRTVVKAQEKYPDSGAIKDKFINRKFWKTRLFFYFLKPHIALYCNHVEQISNLIYKVEFNRFIPKGYVYDKD